MNTDRKTPWIDLSNLPTMTNPSMTSAALIARIAELEAALRRAMPILKLVAHERGISAALDPVVLAIDHGTAALAKAQA